MGLHSASGHLEKAARQLSAAWGQATESWKDVKMSEFGDRYITDLEHDARQTIAAMTRMGSMLERIRRDCSDTEMY